MITTFMCSEHQWLDLGNSTTSLCFSRLAIIELMHLIHRDQLVGLTPMLRYFGRLHDPLYGGDAFTSVQVRGDRLLKLCLC